MKVNITITHFNDEWIELNNVSIDRTHPQMLLVTFGDGRIKGYNYRVIKTLEIEEIDE